MAKRGRPPKKIVKHNPSYSRLRIKKVLQDYFMTDPNNPVLIEDTKIVINNVLTQLDATA